VRGKGLRIRRAVRGFTRTRDYNRGRVLTRPRFLISPDSLFILWSQDGTPTTLGQRVLRWPHMGGRCAPVYTSGSTRPGSRCPHSVENSTVQYCCSVRYSMFRPLAERERRAHTTTPPCGRCTTSGETKPREAALSHLFNTNRALLFCPVSLSQATTSGRRTTTPPCARCTTSGEYEVWQAALAAGPLDVFLSHDWPLGIAEPWGRGEAPQEEALLPGREVRNTLYSTVQYSTVTAVQYTVQYSTVQCSIARWCAVSICCHCMLSLCDVTVCRRHCAATNQEHSAVTVCCHCGVPVQVPRCCMVSLCKCSPAVWCHCAGGEQHAGQLPQQRRSCTPCGPATGSLAHLHVNVAALVRHPPPRTAPPRAATNSSTTMDSCQEAKGAREPQGPRGSRSTVSKKGKNFQLQEGAGGGPGHATRFLRSTSASQGREFLQVPPTHPHPGTSMFCYFLVRSKHVLS